MPKILGNYEDLEFSQNEKDFVMNAISSYKKQLNSSDEPIKDKTMAMLITLDEINDGRISKAKNKPSCKKGCGHCCHIQVGASAWEAETILEFMKHKGMEFKKQDIEKLKAQATISNDSEYILSPHRRCVFLGQDNLCQIYEARPGACRNYYVYNDPEDCNTYNDKASGRTLVDFDLNTMPVILTLMELGGNDSLPRQLLKALDKQK